ncbi:hypothetical protein CER18_08835 [Bartonella tribocorum]|uniref:Uncharacterized protein n=1 Tax=Bartonella tribocorum TaxID=85701 RepID=A0A2N9Y8E0_9HYPH|nr:hypothetical protein CER18_08835 [Bartonella tribocorum]
MDHGVLGAGILEVECFGGRLRDGACHHVRGNMVSYARAQGMAGHWGINAHKLFYLKNLI